MLVCVCMWNWLSNPDKQKNQQKPKQSGGTKACTQKNHILSKLNEQIEHFLQQTKENVEQSQFSHGSVREE